MSNLLDAARPWPRLLIGATLLTAVALAGCNNREEPSTAGERIDASADRAAASMDAAGNRIEQSTEAARDAMGNAADAASTAVADTGITVAIKAKLADDEGLNVMDISVETTSGRAQLTGTAPDAAARERATQIAAAVDGVTSVDNQLTIKY
jgi:osmotically-inducible protein OsmY